MEKELKIGILETSLAWQSVLNQVGAPYSFVSDVNDLSPYSFSVIVINSNIREYRG